MTFGYFSEGFNPFWCPPCPGLCNIQCIDPIDFPLLVVGVAAFIAAVMLTYRTVAQPHSDRRGDDEAQS